MRLHDGVTVTKAGSAPSGALRSNESERDPALRSSSREAAPRCRQPSENRFYKAKDRIAQTPMQDGVDEIVTGLAYAALLG